MTTSKFKYLKPAVPSASYEFLCNLGLLEFCVYLAGSFPGTTVFGPIPVQQLCLLALLAQTALIVAFALRQEAHFTPHILWYYGFAFLCLLWLIFPGGSISNDDFHSIIICCCLLVVQSIYVSDLHRFKIICWCYLIVSDINSIMLYTAGSLKLEPGIRLGENIGVNSNYLATYLMYSAIYALWLFYIEKKTWRKIVIIAMFLIVMYPLSLTGSRKYFLAPALFYVIIMMRRDTGEQFALLKRILGILIVLLIVWYLVMNIPALYNALGVRVEGLINSVTGKGEVDESTEIRGALKQLAVVGWLESPIWGNGFDTFRNYSYDHGMGLIYSHCNYTELLFSGGVLLTAAYYSFHAYMLVECINNKKREDVLGVFCMAVILIQLFFDYGGVSYNQFQCQFFMALGYLALNTEYYDSDIIKPKEKKGKYGQ